MHPLIIEHLKASVVIVTSHQSLAYPVSVACLGMLFHVVRTRKFIQLLREQKLERTKTRPIAFANKYCK
jgi:hypothetical protein